MKILLVGGAGFVGNHLATALSKRKHEVFIADRPEIAKQNKNYSALELEDPTSIHSVLNSIRPDCIFHLAAQSSVSRSWESPDSTLKTNILGSLYMFQAAEKILPNSRFIFIGSGEEYGIDCSENSPFTENSHCSPCNPYAVSKLCAGQTLALLAKKNDIKNYVHLRPFNHYGPQQREGFVIADFCAQIARAEYGTGETTIRVGNLAAKRDFLFIEDVISAYCTLAEAHEYPNQIYNLSTGKACSIQEILDYLLSQAKVSIKIEIDPKKFRPIEVPTLVASSTRIFNDFNWKAEHSLDSGLKKTLDWWRTQVKGCSNV